MCNRKQGRSIHPARRRQPPPSGRGDPTPPPLPPPPVPTHPTSTATSFVVSRPPTPARRCRRACSTWRRSSGGAGAEGDCAQNSGPNSCEGETRYLGWEGRTSVHGGELEV